MVVKEEEATPTESAQHIEEFAAPNPFEPEDVATEETPNQIVVSEAFVSHPIPVSLMRTIEQIKADNVKVNERLNKQDLMF